MIEEIIEHYEDEMFLKADGLDEAIIGVCEDFNAPVRLIYSVKKCIEILMKDMDVSSEDLEEGETINDKKYEMAVEHFYYNVKGSYVGEQTPVWCNDDFN